MTEAIYLQSDEIKAVLAMGGVKALFCFDEIMKAADTREAILDACCRLMADGLMTQIDGKYRLRKDVFDVLYPISQAAHALVLTSSDTARGQVILYIGKDISAIRQTPFGGFYLQALTREETVTYITEQLAPDLSEAPTRADREPSGLRPDTPVETLMESSDFLMEKVCLQSRQRQSWVRCVQWDFFPWLERCDADGITTEPMTEEAFCKAIHDLTEGANKG